MWPSRHAITRARGSADLAHCYAAPVLAQCRHITSYRSPGDQLARGMRTVPFEQSLVIVYRAVWLEALAMSVKHPPRRGPRFHTTLGRPIRDERALRNVGPSRSCLRHCSADFQPLTDTGRTMVGRHPGHRWQFGLPT